MTKFILILCSYLIVCSTISAQFDDTQYTIKLSKVKFKDSYRAANSLYKDLHEALGQNFNLGWHSNIHVKAVINTGKAHLIEGMDVKAIGSPQIEFVIKDSNTKDHDKFIFEKEISANSVKSMGDELVSAFVSDLEAHNNLQDFVNEFIEKQYSDGCEKQLEKIDNYIAKKSFDKAMRLLINMMPSPCSEKAGVLQAELLEKQALADCDSKIQKATVMINSGVRFQLKRAVPLLISISPDAPCAKEALELALKVGEQMGKANQNTIDITRYQKYFSSDKNEWKSYYLEQLMRK